MWQMLIGPVSELLNTVLKRVLTPEKMNELDRAKIEQELAVAMSTFDWKAVEGQLAINKAEAESGSLFKGGWRPAIGWTCAAAFAYNFFLQPFFFFVTAKFGTDLSAMPTLDMAALSTVLMGMLGLGGLRTVEKVWKVESR